MIQQFNKGLNIRQLALLVLTLIIANFSLQAQVTITASAGTASGSYTTLKGAFDAVNAGTHQGAIVININASTTETATAVLSASDSGAARYTSINIYPTVDGLSIAGDIANAPLIDFNCADSVIFDGRVNDTGTTIFVLPHAIAMS